jgi:hypothetical protein
MGLMLTTHRIFGKKFRSFTGRNPWLQRFMNDDH